MLKMGVFEEAIVLFKEVVKSVFGIFWSINRLEGFRLNSQNITS